MMAAFFPTKLVPKYIGLKKDQIAKAITSQVGATLEVPLKRSA